jgi:hypothetical protein
MTRKLYTFFKNHFTVLAFIVVSLALAINPIPAKGA